MWLSENCEKCGSRNWIYVTDPNVQDSSILDPEIFECWSCGEKTCMMPLDVLHDIYGTTNIDSAIQMGAIEVFGEKEQS